MQCLGNECRVAIPGQLPGTGEDPRAPVYVDGKLVVTLRGDAIAEDFAKLLDEYVEKRYGSSGSRVG